jgi:exodeoxyribonuclease V alpha subunit
VSRTGALPAAIAGDPFDSQRSIVGAGPLRAFCDATVLSAADVHTAVTLGRLGGSDDRDVLLAVALAVRAVRLGHVFVDLTTAASSVFPDDEDIDIDVASLPWPAPATWPALLAASRLTAVGADGDAARPLRLIGSRLYLDRYWRHERCIAEDLVRRGTGAPPTVDAAVLTAGLARLFPAAGTDGPGADLQRVAAASAVLRRFSVIAGGPGTGKTTTVARVLALLHEQATALGAPPPRVALAAPTGKAAARLAEAVHAEAAGLVVEPAVRDALLATPASTLHRLLGWQPGNRSRFRHDENNQLPHNVVIVDESSMVSLSMMAKLLVSVRDSARLVLVGDPRQLASVEAGAVLGDIVGPSAQALQLRPAARAGLERVVGGAVVADDPGPGSSVGDGIVVLRHVHRFGGGIARLAEAIESGVPAAVLAVLEAQTGDVEWIETDTTLLPTRAPELAGVRDAVITTATAVVDAARAGAAADALAALRSVQVLCAHRRGPTGASLWRGEIERWLRATIPGYATGAGGGAWYAGRPLIVTENDYALGVFNGDTGVVIDAGEGRLRAVFDRRGEILSVRPTRLASVDSLYAMTIHKAQGSQFGHAIVVLPDPGSPVLTRELLYTAVTRAQTKLTVVGSAAAVAAAVARPVARASGLVDALWPG